MPACGTTSSPFLAAPAIGGRSYPSVVVDARNAPRVLAVGDLHVDSFGTWRDTEGRLAWGVDDFDDAHPLPYTNDLVRLATSARIARDAGLIDIRPRDACEAILEGYVSTLRQGGSAFVLAESHEHLEKSASRRSASPALLGTVARMASRARPATIGTARAGSARVAPDHSWNDRATGSRSWQPGQPRFAMIAICDGAEIAREAKALIPPKRYYERAMTRAIRSPDPFQCVVGHGSSNASPPTRTRSRSRRWPPSETKRGSCTRWASRPRTCTSAALPVRKRRSPMCVGATLDGSITRPRRWARPLSVIGKTTGRASASPASAPSRPSSAPLIIRSRSPACDWSPFSAPARLQRALFSPAHRARDFLRRCLAISRGHCSLLS